MRNLLATHEIGTDSFEMHMLANSLSIFGEARWWEHPLSIIGMYPNSYASAISFLTSGSSQMTGLSIENAIYYYSLIGSIFVIYASYTVAGLVYKNDFFKFIVAYVYSLSPGIIEYTTWTAQGRSLYLLMLPIFIFLLLKTRSLKPKYIMLTCLMGLFIITIHHMWFYLIPITGLYIAILLVHFIRKFIDIPDIISSSIPIILLLAFGVMFGFPFITHKFMTLGSRWYNLANLPIEYPRYSGFSIILAAGGLMYLILKKERSIQEMFIIVSVIVLTVFIFQTMYTKWIMIFFVSLLAGIGYINLTKINIKNTKYKMLPVILFLVLSTSFSGYFSLVKEYDVKYINENTFETGLWIKDNLNGVGIGNSRWETWKIAAISSKPILTGSSSTDQAYGLVNSSDFELDTLPITSEEFWLNSPYYRVSGRVSDSYWQLIMAQYYNSKGYQYIDYFNIKYMIEYTEITPFWYSHHGTGQSEFIVKLHNENDCIYDSGEWNLWFT
nr:hypothetical protein [uncultured Methanolobus sp.]